MERGSSTQRTRRGAKTGLWTSHSVRGFLNRPWPAATRRAQTWWSLHDGAEVVVAYVLHLGLAAAVAHAPTGGLSPASTARPLSAFSVGHAAGRYTPRPDPPGYVPSAVLLASAIGRGMVGSIGGRPCRLPVEAARGPCAKQVTPGRPPDLRGTHHPAVGVYRPSSSRSPLPNSFAKIFPNALTDVPAPGCAVASLRCRTGPGSFKRVGGREAGTIR